jgi:hypothetical protein
MGKKFYRFSDFENALDTINAGIVLTNAFHRLTKKDLYAWSKFDRNRNTYYRTNWYVRDIRNETNSLVEIIHEIVTGALPGITKKNLFNIILNNKMKGFEKFRVRCIEKENEQNENFHFHWKKNRIYPLKRETYNKWALNIYKKYGAPKLRKQFINGVKFGGQFTVQKSNLRHWGKDKFMVKVVDYRVIGLMLVHSNTKPILAFQTESGSFFLNGKLMGDQWRGRYVKRKNKRVTGK